MNPVGFVTRALERGSLLRRLVHPVLAFTTLVVLGVVGYRSLGGIGTVDAEPLAWTDDRS